MAEYGYGFQAGGGYYAQSPSYAYSQPSYVTVPTPQYVASPVQQFGSVSAQYAYEPETEIVNVRASVAPQQAAYAVDNSYNDCRISPPRIKQEVVRDETPAPLVRQEVQRAPTPEPDTIERTIYKREPAEIIERVIQQPRKPPPRVLTKVVNEPRAPPQVRTRCVLVDPRPRGAPAQVQVRAAPAPGVVTVQQGQSSVDRLLDAAVQQTVNAPSRQSVQSVRVPSSTVQYLN